MKTMFVAVFFDHRSVVPSHTRAFRTLPEAKAAIEANFYGTVEDKTGWSEWAEGKFVFGHRNEDGEIDEPIGAVYGSDVE